MPKFAVGDRVQDTEDYLGLGTVEEIDPGWFEGQAGVRVTFDREDRSSWRLESSLKEWRESDDFALRVRNELSSIADLLIEKNRKYGDSALSPVRTFSKADTVEQIKVRIDDKLSRIQRGVGDDEDTVTDLIGYLVLLRLAQQ